MTDKLKGPASVQQKNIKETDPITPKEEITKKIRGILTSALEKIGLSSKKSDVAAPAEYHHQTTRRARIIHYVSTSVNEQKPAFGGEWEDGKKDPSLPDNPTREQLEAAGYKQYSVTIPLFHTPGGGPHHAARQRNIGEIFDRKKIMREAASNAAFVFNSEEKSGSYGHQSVFIKGSSPEA
jgi:hypothetical protein